MVLTTDQVEEIKILTSFHLSSSSLQKGIKIHNKSADSMTISAAQRLFKKGLITQSDGGYLTDLGIEAAEHVQSALTILSP